MSVLLIKCKSHEDKGLWIGAGAEDNENIRISWFHCILLLLFFFLPGLDKIEFLQSHENQEIYQKAFDLIEHYFGIEDDSALAPQVDENQQQFIFQQAEAPMEGFQL